MNVFTDVACYAFMYLFLLTARKKVELKKTKAGEMCLLWCQLWRQTLSHQNCWRQQIFLFHFQRHRWQQNISCLPNKLKVLKVGPAWDTWVKDVFSTKSVPSGCNGMVTLIFTIVTKLFTILDDITWGNCWQHRREKKYHVDCFHWKRTDDKENIC